MNMPKIMVVEDERIVALHLRQQLEKLGYEVPAVVSSGQQALDRVGRERPDLILMDIKIDGDMDGIETASRLPSDNPIPVVYLTAYSEEATLARARETQPHGYLLKPFSERELHATIQMALERKKAETARSEQEERTHQTQKLEAIGQLAGGVAHDFNNLLAVIQGNLELMKDLAPSPELSDMIQDALRAASRGASLTQQLLAYSRRQPLLPQVLDLPALVADLTKLLRRLLDETIDIHTRMPSGMWKIRADQSQLESALLNLAVNARDAMPGGGTLTISGMNADITAPDPDIHGEMQAGAYAALAVGDTGTGMPDDIVAKALEPFFTTKPLGKGTGLGLSQVLGFVRQSQGGLKIETRPDHGTTVYLYFPAIEADLAEVAPPTPVADTSAAKGEVVLVVEDDAMVRKLVLRMLMSLGYKTIEAEEGATAFEILRGNQPIDLLMTDLVLPKGISGMALAHEARRQRPDMKVLFMSGYTAGTFPDGPADDDTTRFIAKPFGKIDLALKVRQVLAG
ncbi:response regulator [Iodidimonas sp. SYSU 1G8]|uniref:hybrid sensor histidine kinase/response regulator n=1 Tax=Iodidimonas sp. SYSU 1G8 TaxID=3133967 RepID=UPI0031FED6DF